MRDPSLAIPPPAAVAALLGARRTIHDFRPDAPPLETIRRAIDLARWAPNHRLTEPWRFYLLGPETAARVADLNAELVAAKEGPVAAEDKRRRWRAVPGWVAVTSARGDDALREREDYAACCCAIQNLMLYLWSEEIGVKWTTGQVTREPRFYDLIWADPVRETVVGLLWYGYPAEVPRTARRPLASCLVTLS
jgi:nitroreductase